MPLPKKIEEDEPVTRTEVSPFAPMFGFAEAMTTAAFDYAEKAIGRFAAAAPAKADPPGNGEVFRVGEYYADYSLLTPKEIAQPDSEADALFKRSKPVSR
ncbi:MAG TPA: hypothetical protein VL048_10475 [Xanthobacteraceae bacterium]|nr:hypothetical protein [Xanthobacteraceae bacterium]